MGASQANDNLWEMLQRDGDVLDLMAIEAIGTRVLLVGAKYEEQRLPVGGEPVDDQMNETEVRKLMHIISLNSEEKIEWQHSFPAIPDVNEVYSMSATRNGHLCIAYGRNYADNEFINPVVLQVDAKGKIGWADIEAIPESFLPDTSAKSYLQIANLESIRVIDTADNGCLLGYILRQESQNEETLQLNLIMINRDGSVKWHFNRETDLYGKMFLVHNNDSNIYIVVQTNQSRDAAIQAMMAGRPFSPKTSMLVMSPDGEMKNFYDFDTLTDLSKVWVKQAVGASGAAVLLVGNAKNAWAGLVSEKGKLGTINNTLNGEFSYATKMHAGGYILVRSGSLVALDNQLNLMFDKPIEPFIRRNYVNAYLAKELTEQGPIQNIVPISKNTYLVLYKLASRLQKIEFPD